MSLPRVLETELMDTPQEAADYDAMDHRAVNELFVTDLLAAMSSRFKVQGSKLEGSNAPSTLNFEPGTLNLDVLDVGTGTAQIPIELCRRFKECRVMAVDAAAHMLELARYNVEAAGLIERIQLVKSDAKTLGFADAFFDVVMSNSIVHHIPEPRTIFQQAVRVVKPGGLVFFRDLLRPQSRQRLDELVQTYAGQENAHARQMFADSLHAALSLDEVRGLVAPLGFSPDSVQQTSDRHWTWCAARGT
jgi:ubiquinone/menaquinone biosynthesis C-methylase UbiE